MSMKITDPPLNGNARQKLAWLLGLVLSLLIFLSFASGAMLLAHDSKLAVHDTRIGTVEKALDGINGKLDRLLERRP